MFEETTREREHQRVEGQAALDWQKLYTWAHEQPEGTVLGRSCTNTEDPLCTYLGAMTQTRPEVWSVGPSIKTGYHDRLEKHSWVQRLIEATDQATEHQSAPVTREVYLRVLMSVKP